MKQQKIKIEKTLYADQIAEFLRRLADEIENRRNVSRSADLEVDLHNFNKLKVGLIKRRGGQLTLKVKLKEKPVSEKVSNIESQQDQMNFEDIAEIKYRPLKKRMKQTFATISRSIRNNEMPDKKSVDQFLEESKLMVSYAGFGDEYYGSYMTACKAFHTGFTKQNFDEMASALKEITRLKNECHGRYK